MSPVNPKHILNELLNKNTFKIFSRKATDSFNLNKTQIL
jgi:hypothetical protein